MDVDSEVKAEEEVELEVKVVTMKEAEVKAEEEEAEMMGEVEVKAEEQRRQGHIDETTTTRPEEVKINAAFRAGRIPIEKNYGLTNCVF